MFSGVHPADAAGVVGNLLHGVTGLAAHAQAVGTQVLLAVERLFALGALGVVHAVCSVRPRARVRFFAVVIRRPSLLGCVAALPPSREIASAWTEERVTPRNPNVRFCPKLTHPVALELCQAGSELERVTTDSGSEFRNYVFDDGLHGLERSAPSSVPGALSRTASSKGCTRDPRGVLEARLRPLPCSEVHGAQT